MRVAVTGSSGFIGTALVRALEARGDDVLRLVRGPASTATAPAGAPAVREIEWHPDRGEIDARALDGADAVINLAGESIGNRRWSTVQKQRVLESRVRATTLLAETIAASTAPPKAFISGSAIGYYGSRGDTELDEAAEPGHGFLADVVVQWERAAARAESHTRVAYVRTGLVLDKRGGSLPRMLLPFRLGVGGRLGSGRQYMSWITLDDHVRALCWLLDTDARGPFNLATPNPVTNVEFTRALGRALHRPTVMPVPTVALHLLLGRELADELLFASQRVIPKALVQSGFAFVQPDIDRAFAHIFAK